MNKKLRDLAICFLIFIFLTGCQPKENEVDTINNNEKMEGMEHLYAFNEYGYYFDVYSELSKDRERDGILNMEKSTDTLYMEIENAGVERNMAIQIFIDYVQVPILVEGREYTTYRFNADDKFSGKFSFRLKNQIDEEVNHKITAIMTDADDVTGGEPGETYSLAYDMILEFDKSNELAVEELYDCEEPETIYEDMFQGLLINDDLEEFKRRIPKKVIDAKPNEKIKLSYHVGGYEDCQEVLVILSLGMEQTGVNTQNYIRCKVKDKEIFNGTLEITAPDETGEYVLTGWAIKNPFSEIAVKSIPLRNCPGFIINVCE